MLKEISNWRDYLYIDSQYTPNDRQEATIWWIKCLSNQFVTLMAEPGGIYDLLKMEYLDLEKIDPLLKFDTDTIFGAMIKGAHYNQATHFIYQFNKHPQFSQMLNLTDPDTIEAIQRLFDYAIDEKTPICKRDMREIKAKQELRNALCLFVSPSQIAALTGKPNETDFSAVLKLKIMTPEVIKNITNQWKTLPQENIMAALNERDTETQQILKECLNPRSKSYNLVITNALQNLLTAENFITLQGLHMDYRSRWELQRDKRYMDSVEKNTDTPPVKPEKSPTDKPPVTDELFQWAFKHNGREK